jgi:hypothetical protein
MSDEQKTYKMQHPGSCTGMFWRSAPANLTHREAAGTKPDWPRNGALLRGYVHKTLPKDGNDTWLEVMSYKPSANAAEFVAAPNCWMQFNQDGLLLHDA